MSVHVLRERNDGVVVATQPIDQSHAMASGPGVKHRMHPRDYSIEDRESSAVLPASTGSPTA